jgi:hypothetical protein
MGVEVRTVVCEMEREGHPVALTLVPPVFQGDPLGDGGVAMKKVWRETDGGSLRI